MTVGPYCNDCGDWWYPTDAWKYNDAAHDASQQARESDGRSRYVGKEFANLHDHDWDGSQTCCQREAYRFVTYEPAR